MSNTFVYDNNLDTTNNNYICIKFIDRASYNAILSKNYTIDDLAKELKHPIANKDTRLSILTKAYLFYVDAMLANNIIFSSILPKKQDSDLFYLNELIQNEVNYIKDKFKEDLNSECYLEKYYELIGLPDDILLVIVENGFLKHITETKDNLIEFILNCLCYLYKFKYNLQYMLQVYIKLKMNDNYFTVVKLNSLAVS